MIEIKEKDFIEGMSLRFIFKQAEIVGTWVCVVEQLYAQMLGLDDYE